jgi:CheY-like chemotaxis protein
MDQTPHILVIDDDREIRDLLARFLEKQRMRVTAVRDGKEARRAWLNGHYQLVVLDLMLPGESGLDLARWLRSQSEIPIVMLTAMGEETDRIIGLELGADDYVPKPFNPRELLARIRAVLRRSGDQGETKHDPSVRGYRFYAAGAGGAGEPRADPRHAAGSAARASGRAVRPGDRCRGVSFAPQTGGRRTERPAYQDGAWRWLCPGGDGGAGLKGRDIEARRGSTYLRVMCGEHAFA